MLLTVSYRDFVTNVTIKLIHPLLEEINKNKGDKTYLWEMLEVIKI